MYFIFSEIMSMLSVHYYMVQ